VPKRTARDHTTLHHHQYKQHNTYKKEHSTVNARIMPQVLLLVCLLPHVLDAKPQIRKVNKAKQNKTSQTTMVSSLASHVSRCGIQELLNLRRRNGAMYCIHCTKSDDVMYSSLARGFEVVRWVGIKENQSYHIDLLHNSTHSIYLPISIP
jgi:hypothetical protein